MIWLRNHKAGFEEDAGVLRRIWRQRWWGNGKKYEMSVGKVTVTLDSCRNCMQGHIHLRWLATTESCLFASCLISADILAHTWHSLGALPAMPTAVLMAVRDKKGVDATSVFMTQCSMARCNVAVISSHLPLGA